MALADANPWLIAADILDPKDHPYVADPVGFVRDELGGHPWSKQREILEAIRDHDRVAIRSCHGIGKTWLLAQVVLWYLAIYRDCKVITTAPTFRQVKQLLWREIRSSVERAHLAGRLLEFPDSGHTQLELGTQRFALGQSTDQPEAFAGHHAQHLLFVGDEASGIAEAIYEAAEGFQTAEGAKMLLAGNPTRVGGQFHRAFNNERAQWRTIHVSAYDTPNYTGEAADLPAHVARSMIRKGWAEEKAAQWGEDSPMYEVRVLGQFPSRATDAVVSLADVEDAQARVLPPTHPTTVRKVRVTCDVARFGDDETVIATRHDQQVRIREAYVGRDLMRTVGHIIRVWKKLRDESGANPEIVVDDAGLGGGVTDRLRELGYGVIAFNGAERAREAEEYPNRRSEAWYELAEKIADLDLPDDEQLAADLTSPTYRMDSQGRRVVEPKADTKKRLRRSPDRADAVILTVIGATPVVVPDAAPAPARRIDDLGDTSRAPDGTFTGDLLDAPM